MLGESLIGMIILAVVLADTQVDAMLASAVGAELYWLISLLIGLPARALIWPLIPFAVRRRLSRLMPALPVCGSTAGRIGLSFWSVFAIAGGGGNRSITRIALFFEDEFN